MSCAQLPKSFESQPGGMVHRASSTFFPSRVSEYFHPDGDRVSAIHEFDKNENHISVAYFDYRSGGIFSSNLYRARAHVFVQPKSLVKGDAFETEKKAALALHPGAKVLSEDKSKTSNGLRQLVFETEMPMSTPDMSGISWSKIVPVVSRLAVIPKGDWIWTFRVTYPKEGAEEFATTSDAFVPEFLKLQSQTSVKK